MKILDIDACAEGIHREYDVDCYQEIHFTVAAETLDDALQMILDSFEECHGDYSNSIDSVFYNTATVTEREDEEGGDAEIIDYERQDPVCSPDTPKEYNAEIVGIRVSKDESK